MKIGGPATLPVNRPLAVNNIRRRAVADLAGWSARSFADGTIPGPLDPHRIDAFVPAASRTAVENGVARLPLSGRDRG